MTTKLTRARKTRPTKEQTAAAQAELRKLTEKEVRFNYARLRKLSLTAAAIDAGYSRKTAYAIGSTLKKKPNVAAHFAELLAEARKEALVTFEGHVADLAAIRDLAIDDGNHSAAASAEVSRGRAAGLYVDRVRVEDNLSEEELEERVVSALRTAAARKRAAENDA